MLHLLIQKENLTINSQTCKINKLSGRFEELHDKFKVNNRKLTVVLRESVGNINWELKNICVYVLASPTS